MPGALPIGITRRQKRPIGVSVRSRLVRRTAWSGGDRPKARYITATAPRRPTGKSISCAGCSSAVAGSAGTSHAASFSMLARPLYVSLRPFRARLPGNNCRYHGHGPCILPGQPIQTRGRAIRLGLSRPHRQCRAATVQLLRRTWHITDATGHTLRVHGDGRGRREPRCSSPAKTSNTPPARRSTTPSGFMTGEYHMLVIAAGDEVRRRHPRLQPGQPAAGHRLH